jgi:hypothetical protein
VRKTFQVSVAGKQLVVSVPRAFLRLNSADEQLTTTLAVQDVEGAETRRADDRRPLYRQWANGSPLGPVALWFLASVSSTCANRGEQTLDGSEKCVHPKRHSRWRFGPREQLGEHVAHATQKQESTKGLRELDISEHAASKCRDALCAIALLAIVPACVLDSPRHFFNGRLRGSCDILAGWEPEVDANSTHQLFELVETGHLRNCVVWSGPNEIQQLLVEARI